ncbi:MAG TPA: hypothetical protein VHE35_33475 [Kofleriaceae bacterium]|nr:hypothetical protein [Kofleriaceae bacterium]
MRTQSSILLLSILGALALSACGGDDGGGSSSGVDTSKKLVDLSASDKQTFCAWRVATEGGEGHSTDCGDGITITTGSVAECVSGFDSFSASCTATVGDAEGCVEASAANECDPGSACDAIFACITN